MSTPNLITADRCPSCGGFNTNRGKTRLWCNDCQRHTWQYGKYGEREPDKEVAKEQSTSSPLPPVISDNHGEQECSVSDCPCHEWVRRFGGRVSGRECDYPPSLIDAAKKVEQWWLQLDKNKHGFYGAPECVFSLRAAIEECDRERQPVAGGGGESQLQPGMNPTCLRCFNDGWDAHKRGLHPANFHAGFATRDAPHTCNQHQSLAAEREWWRLLLGAAKNLLSMNNCNYDRDTMRSEDGFDALQRAVEAIEQRSTPQ